MFQNIPVYKIEPFYESFEIFCDGLRRGFTDIGKRKGGRSILSECRSGCDSQQLEKLKTVR